MIVEMAKTYKINGYIVDPNGDDYNEIDICKLLDRYTDSFYRITTVQSPTWEWDDDCPENHESLTDEMCEKRFERMISHE